MTRIVRFLLLVCLVAAPSRAFAQLADGPIVYGHHHLNVSNIDAAKKFWADTLGGTVVRVGTDHREAVSIPGLWIFFFAKAPTAGSKGSTEDHIGLSVPDLDAAIAKVKANGFRVVTAQEAPPSYKVTGDVASPAPNTRLAFIMGPDDAKVELVEAKAQTEPVKLSHIHFASDENLAMRDWYVKTFGAAAVPSAPNPPFYGASLPGVRLSFSPAAAKPAGTDGRAYDHIGFEVKDLAGFLKKLEAEGIKPAQPMRHNDVLNINLAFITDPWGTKIELTQGLSTLH